MMIYLLGKNKTFKTKTHFTLDVEVLEFVTQNCLFFLFRLLPFVF